MNINSPLNDEQGRKLLDTIDNIRLLPAVSHEIALPQVVVVGALFSGRESVLKAITKVDFPTNNGLGTLFATEIVCRREAQETTKASIIPSGLDSELDTSSLEDFSQRWEDAGTDWDSTKIIAEANMVIGLHNKKRLSRDRLRLEFSGPQLDNISIIDLPFLADISLHIHQDEDKYFMEDVMKEYIRDEQTIILAVFSGSFQQEAQRICDALKAYQKRVMGIITAPDQVNVGTSCAQTFQKLVNNEPFAAGHGWHVLRNLTCEEQSRKLNRDMVEQKYFELRPPGVFWGDVPESRLGVMKLRNNLVSLLQQSIQKELPDIQNRLKTAIKKDEEELKLLGNERVTFEQQRDYLAEKSRKLQAETTKQLNGGTNGCLLRSKIRIANDRFTDQMIEFGATWAISSDTSQPKKVISPIDNTCLGKPPISITYDSWIREMLYKVLENKGCEMDGTLNPTWVGEMFKEQSRKWTSFAESHADKTYEIVVQYFREAIANIMNPEDTARIWDGIVFPELEKRHQNLRTKVSELLTPYTTEHIKTQNRSFRATQGYKTSLSSDTNCNMQTRSMVMHFANRMIAFYEIALNVFVDNMESLAIENVLLDGLADIMTEEKAYKMDETKLGHFTTESEAIAKKRRGLQVRRREFEEASRIISDFVTRGQQIVKADVSCKPLPQPLSFSVPNLPEMFVAPSTTGFKFLKTPSDESSPSNTLYPNSSENQVPETPTTAGSSRASGGSQFPSASSNKEGEMSSAPSSANSSLAKKSPSVLFDSTPSKLGSGNCTLGTTSGLFGSTPADSSSSKHGTLDPKSGLSGSKHAHSSSSRPSTPGLECSLSSSTPPSDSSSSKSSILGSTSGLSDSTPSGSSSLKPIILGSPFGTSSYSPDTLGAALSAESSPFTLGKDDTVTKNTGLFWRKVVEKSTKSIRTNSSPLSSPEL